MKQHSISPPSLRGLSFNFIRGNVAADARASDYTRNWVHELLGMPCKLEARLDGYVAGYVSGFKQGFHVHLDALYVRPEYRRHGLGRQLMSRMIGHFPACSFDASPQLFEVSLASGLNEQQLRAFYRSIGFQADPSNSARIFRPARP